VGEDEWCIRITKPKKVVDSLKNTLSENHNVKTSRRVVREIAEIFKGRTKLAITTAVAYMLWMGLLQCHEGWRRHVSAPMLWFPPKRN